MSSTRVSLLTLGSRGDVQPYVALALGLAQADFDVEVVTGREFEPWIASHSIPCRPLDVDMGALAQSRAGRAAIAGQKNEAQARLKEQLRLVREQAREAVAGRDLVVFHPVVAPFVSRFAAESSLQLVQAALKPTNPGPFRGNLYAYSSHVVPHQAVSPEEVITGFWFLDDFDPEWSADAELVRFLDEGSDTVYVGFGSMASIEPERVGEIVLEAVERSGVQAVVSRGWGGIASRGSADHVFWLDRAPHDWLFPRMRAVVHHGGVGTMASALRAGKPMVICPFAIDQPFWGNVMAEHGAAPRPIPQSDLSVGSLSDAIREALDDGCTVSAERLGERVRAEDGVLRSVEAISDWVGRPR